MSFAAANNKLYNLHLGMHFPLCWRMLHACNNTSGRDRPISHRVASSMMNLRIFTLCFCHRRARMRGKLVNLFTHESVFRTRTAARLMDIKLYSDFN